MVFLIIIPKIFVKVKLYFIEGAVPLPCSIREIDTGNMNLGLGSGLGGGVFSGFWGRESGPR